MKRATPLGITFLMCNILGGQTTVVGSITDAITSESLSDVKVSIANESKETFTNDLGVFTLYLDIDIIGDQLLVISKTGFITKRLPLIVYADQELNLGRIPLDIDIAFEQKQIGLISLSDNDLNSDDDDVGNFNIPGILSAGRDAFSSAAAFDWSSTFFRPRGFDSSDGKILINGIEMNKQFNGRPQWSNWGGLNDAQRNQETARGLAASDHTFGGIAGVNNIIMRAGQQRKGGRVSYATSSRTYQGRVMASYNSGISTSGWAYSFLISRRYGSQGFQEGTLYDANSIYTSLEKKLSKNHNLNVTAFYTPNRRGRSSALTQEVFDLKGRAYNPFWGLQGGEQRNTRIRKIEEPVFMLNHYWSLGDNTTLNTNLAYQTGVTKNSRIDNGGLRNPAPDYYQSLPSFALQDEIPTVSDFQNALLLQQEFVNDGQYNWPKIYQSNRNGSISNIILQQDVIEDTQLTATLIFNSQISDHFELDGNLSHRSLISENYAEVGDLLGGEGFLDIDNFSVNQSQDGQEGTLAQSNVQTPNRVVTKGDRYKYNYHINASVASGFVQGQFSYNKADFFLSATGSNTTYQRTGLYENGNFLGNLSLGTSDQLSFTTGGFKAGLTYKLTGRHLLEINTGLYTDAPSIRNSFSNSRQNNETVIDIEGEQIQSFDLSYNYRSPIVKARITGFYTGFSKGTDLGFFFTQNNIAGENAAFVQEILTNVSRQNIGIELGVEAQVLPTLKIKTAASIGQYTYSNNPDIYYTSDDFEGPVTFGDGTVALKNLHVAGGPERAYQVGLDYRDLDYWNFGATLNYFSNAYVDISNIARTTNFYQDLDGQPFNDYDSEVARSLLQQKEIDPYFLVNIIGGKSWRVGKYYVGFFAVVNNVLDQTYITGGFEQSRRANYRTQLEESQRINPLFGDRLFFGSGATYYLNGYVRF